MPIYRKTSPNLRVTLKQSNNFISLLQKIYNAKYLYSKIALTHLLSGHNATDKTPMYECRQVFSVICPYNNYGEHSLTPKQHGNWLNHIVEPFTTNYRFGYMLSTKIFHSVCWEIQGDPQNLKMWEKLYSKPVWTDCNPKSRHSEKIKIMVCIASVE